MRDTFRSSLISSLMGLLAFALSPSVFAAPSVAAATPSKAQAVVDAATRDAFKRAAFVKTGQRVAEVCASCHGLQGTSTTSDVPNMAAQNVNYVYEQLRKFSTGERNEGSHSKFMRSLTRAMSEDEKAAVADFYAQQSSIASRAPGAAAAKGKAIYNARCLKCHGDDGAGAELLPLIAGQQPAYLNMSLERYRKQTGARLFAAMTKVMQGMTDQDMVALIDYVSSMH
jgi:cytochrome c553